MKTRAIAIFVLSIAVVSTGAYIILRLNPNRSNNPTDSTIHQSFTDNKQGISFDYSSTLKQIELNGDDLKDNFVFRAENIYNTDPPILISVRYENGLKAASTVTKQSKIELVMQNLRKAYPKRFPSFEEVSSNKTEIDSKTAQEVVFTYTSNSINSKQRLLIIDKNEDTVIYVSMQSKNSDYDKLDSEIFTPITNSIKIK
ncbi:MAG: hypothetical protein AAB459_00555 [Patescibacteria group bacterium]